MILQAPQVMERDELMQHRREGGAWLRSLRELAGLSQRELATAVGADYYSFVSQLEAGKGRVPVSQVELWAKALGVPRPVFAKGLLRHYDPITYDMLFSDDERAVAQVTAEDTKPAENEAMPVKPAAPVEELQPIRKPAGRSPVADDLQAVDEDLRARVNRIEAILMMRGAR